MSPHRHHHRFDRAVFVSVFAAVSAIASVYIYFLLFAEFAFLELARETIKNVNLTALMAAMGLAGVSGSLAAARWYSSEKGTSLLSRGFVACAIAAGASLVAHTMVLAIIAAALVGASLAWTTVVLSLCLRPTLHLKKLGTWCGLGTGLAYAFCNQPPVFTASSRTQIVIAIIVALFGFIVSFRLTSEPSKPSTSPDYHPFAAGLWVVLFLGLVWLDSGAFFILQRDPTLKAQTWDGALTLLGNAFVHLCAAVIAGLALDRRQLSLTLGAALLLLVTACLILGGSAQYFPTAKVLYTAGVSAYSAALVYFAARGGKPWLSGILFAVSGWFGSAAGISMAHTQDGVPLAFVLTTATVSITAFIARHFWLRHQRVLAEASGLANVRT